MSFNEFDESDPDYNLTETLYLIRELADHDPAEVPRYRETITECLPRGLKSEYHHALAVEAIFSLLALALTDETTQPWFNPVLDLVEQHDIHEGNLFDLGFREVMAAFRGFVGVYGNLNKVRITVVDDLFQAYIKLIKVLAYKPSLRITQDLFDQALIIAKRLGDRIETAKLYQTLALYNAHIREFELAENYAQRAFAISEAITDPAGIADAACTLAIVYRSGLRFQRATYFLQRAMQQIPSGKLDKRFATLFYECAVSAYREDKFDLALSYYRRALEIYEEFEAIYQITMTHQGMAQAYLHQGEFEEAETCLHFAREHWEKLGNAHEHVNTFFIEAILEHKRGNRSQALILLRRTIDHAYGELPASVAREELINQVKAYIERRISFD